MNSCRTRYVSKPRSTSHLVFLSNLTQGYEAGDFTEDWKNEKSSRILTDALPLENQLGGILERLELLVKLLREVHERKSNEKSSAYRRQRKRRTSVDVYTREREERTGGILILREVGERVSSSVILLNFPREDSGVGKGMCSFSRAHVRFYFFRKMPTVSFHRPWVSRDVSTSSSEGHHFTRAAHESL